MRRLDDARRSLGVRSGIYYKFGAKLQSGVYAAEMWTTSKTDPSADTFVGKVCVKRTAIESDGNPPVIGAKPPVINVFRELKIYCMLQAQKLSPHAELVDAFTSGNHHNLVFEFAEKGDLFGYLSSMDISKTQHVMRQLCKHVIDLHNNDVAHMDLSPENILVLDDDLTIKLCDFSYSAKFSRDAIKHFNLPGFEHPLDNIRIGKVYYMDPDIYNRLPASAFGADCWSAGIILALMMNKGHVLYEKPSCQDKNFVAIQHFGLAHVFKLCSMDSDDAAYALGIDLVQILWSRKSRLTEDILSHPFLKLE